MPGQSKSKGPSSSRRRSARLHKSSSGESGEERKEEDLAMMKEDGHDSDESNESDEEEEAVVFVFDGKVYDTYQDMVNAKRKRNEQYLKDNGLWKPMQQFMPPSAKQESKGIKKRKISSSNAYSNLPRRKSNRLQGTPADGRFVEHEGGGTIIVSGQDATGNNAAGTATHSTSTEMVRERGRVNDGDPLSLSEAIHLCDDKWIQETSVEAAEKFVKESLNACATHASNDKKLKQRSPTSVADKTIAFTMESVREKINQLSVDDESMVAKVTPDRIYSVAAHPSKSNLMVCAGDKNGYVGLWNVNSSAENKNDGVHLFRFHSRPVNTLEWISADGLLSSSYDGTVRYFDVHQQSFEQVFATRPEEDDFYTQYLTLDPRSSPGQAFFLSTSAGTAMHIDRRIGSGNKNGGNLTFHAQVSEKKVNSISLHRDGYCLATGGLDRTVKFWDLRKFGSPASTPSKSRRSSSLFSSFDPTEPKGAFLGECHMASSVNSCFFAPSGDRLLTTNMVSGLHIFENAHMQVTQKKPSKNGVKVFPDHSIRHNNNTGRWLTTFMAQWHPELDCFVVGSMEKPRGIDVYDGTTGDHLRAIQGEAMTAVASRCCFHPSTDKLVIVGGNSSGRVTVIC